MTVEVGLFWLILGLFPLKKQVLQKNCASLDARSDLIFFGWNVLLEWSVRGSCWEIGRRTPTKKCPINVRNKHFSDHLPSNYLGSNLVMVEVQFRVCEIYLLTYINNVLSGRKPIGTVYSGRSTSPSHSMYSSASSEMWNEPQLF